MSYMLRMLRREDRRLLSGRAEQRRTVAGVSTVIDSDLPCTIRPAQRATTEVSSGGEQVSLAIYDVRVPYDTDIRRGDVLTLTRSWDVMQVGQWVTVIEVVVDEWVTTRMAVCHRSRS